MIFLNGVMQVGWWSYSRCTMGTYTRVYWQTSDRLCGSRFSSVRSTCPKLHSFCSSNPQGLLCLEGVYIKKFHFSHITLHIPLFACIYMYTWFMYISIQTFLFSWKVMGVYVYDAYGYEILIENLDFYCVVVNLVHIVVDCLWYINCVLTS